MGLPLLLLAAAAAVASGAPAGNKINLRVQVVELG